MSDPVRERIDKAAEIMLRHNIPATCLAVVSGLSNTELSALFHNTRPCPPYRAVHILNCVQALEELAQAVSPLPVDWRKSEVLRVAIAKIGRGDLKVLTIDFTSGVQALNDTAVEAKV